MLNNHRRGLRRRVARLWAVAALLAADVICAQPGADPAIAGSGEDVEQNPVVDDVENEGNAALDSSRVDSPKKETRDTFVPSEDISEDRSVSFPTDI